MEGDQERVARFFPELGLRPRGWKKDQVLERCLVWRGGFVCRFPSLFNLALNKEARVADIWDSGDGGWWMVTNLPKIYQRLGDWRDGKIPTNSP